MNLAMLKVVCARIMGKTVVVAGQDDFTENGVDFFLIAANNARKSAELLHNFEFARVTALLDIVGENGALLDTATITSYDPIAAVTTIREVIAVTRQRPDGTWIPMDFCRSDIPIERDRWELEMSDNMFPYLRYPSDALINARGTTASVIQRGRWIFIYPYYANMAPYEYELMFEGYGWLADYTAAGDLDDAPQDFFMAYGAAYMQWAIICELNMIFQRFVQRLEGSVAPPEKQRDAEFQKLLVWDSYMIDSNMTRPR